MVGNHVSQTKTAQMNIFRKERVRGTVCPRSCDPFYIITYYIKWVTTSWTHSTYSKEASIHLLMARTNVLCDFKGYFFSFIFKQKFTDKIIKINYVSNVIFILTLKEIIRTMSVSRKKKVSYIWFSANDWYITFSTK